MLITLNCESLNVCDFEVEVDVEVEHYSQRETYWEPGYEETTVESYSYDKAEVQRQIDEHIAIVRHDHDLPDYTLTLKEIDGLISDTLNEMARSGELDEEC